LEDGTSKNFCHFYLKDGKCKNGDKCQYFHYDKVIVKKDCEYFIKNGEFSFGDACRFVHPEQYRKIVKNFKPLQLTKEIPKDYKNFFPKYDKNGVSYLLSSCEEFKLLMEYDQVDSIFSFQKMIDILISEDFQESFVCSKVNEMISLFIHGNFIKTLQIYLEFVDLNSLVELYMICIRKFPKFGEMEYITNLETHIIYENQDIPQKFKLLVELTNQSKLEENTKELTAKSNQIKDLPIYPTTERLKKRDPNLMPNNIQGSWKSLDDYLSTHFRLLYEDFMEPLREGIEKFESKTNMKMKELPIFQQGKIQNIQFEKTILLEISFDSNYTSVPLESSKFLNFGALVLLYSSKNSKSIWEQEPIIGTVEDRKKNSEFKIGINITSSFDSIDLEDEFIIFESPTYFKSVGPVLESLKAMENIPFPEILLKSETKCGTPQYIKENPNVNIGSLLKIKKSLSIDVTKNWISLDDTFLDDTQSEAFKNALNSEVAIIKGPQGQER
jgi:hypothetical protein